MRNETRGVFGDQRVIFTDPHSARFIIDNPATDECVAIAKSRQRLKRPVDHRFIGVITISVVNDVILTVENGDVAAFARVDRFTHIAFASGNLRFFTFKPDARRLG